MASLWSTLIPLILGGAVVPSWFLIEILLLQGTRGRFKAMLFVSGFIVMRLVQGLLFGCLLHVSVSGQSELGSSPVVSTILLVVGIFFLTIAARYAFSPGRELEIRQGWESAIDSITPLRTMLFAGLLSLTSARFWLFTLGAVGAIKDSGLGVVPSVANYLVFVVLSVLPMIAIAGTAVLRPARADETLTHLRTWVERHARGIMIGMCLVLGVAMAYLGLSRLSVL